MHFIKSTLLATAAAASVASAVNMHTVVVTVTDQVTITLSNDNNSQQQAAATSSSSYSKIPISGTPAASISLHAAYGNSTAAANSTLSSTASIAMKKANMTISNGVYMNNTAAAHTTSGVNNTSPQVYNAQATATVTVTKDSCSAKAMAVNASSAAANTSMSLLPSSFSTRFAAANSTANAIQNTTISSRFSNSTKTVKNNAAAHQSTVWVTTTDYITNKRPLIVVVQSPTNTVSVDGEATPSIQYDIVKSETKTKKVVESSVKVAQAAATHTTEAIKMSHSAAVVQSADGNGNDNDNVLTPVVGPVSGWYPTQLVTQRTPVKAPRIEYLSTDLSSHNEAYQTAA